SAANGIWPIAGGGTFNTGTTNGAEIVLDGAAIPLAPPAAQTITFPAFAGKTYGDIDFNPGATSTSGLQVVYTSSDPNVATVNGNMIHITGAGSTEITAAQ